MQLEAKDIFLLSLAVPLSIAANLLTPHMRSLWARMSLKQAQHRFNQICRELEFYNRLASDEKQLFVYVFHRFSAAVSLTILTTAYLVLIEASGGSAESMKIARMGAYVALVICANLFVPVSQNCMRARDDNFSRMIARLQAERENLERRIADHAPRSKA